MSEISKSKEPCVTVPPVHGRPNTIPTKNRIGYHQRNLSLDFRSMGILLPPISQVTNTTKVSSHHRNRSLDSVLQRIPEVDVTPSPECETPSSDVTSFENNPKASANRDDYGSLGSDDSGIACRSETASGSTSDRRSHESLGSESNSPICELEIRNDVDSTSNKSFLLRLFDSTLFDMSMAIAYLFNSKEPEVQNYIGKKLFCFPHAEVDFYLPQLINMYIQIEDLSEVIHPYLVQRYRQSCDFSLKCVWLLDAFNVDSPLSCKKSRGAKLKKLILGEECSKQNGVEYRNGEIADADGNVAQLLPNAFFKKTHTRAFSDASTLMTNNNKTQTRGAIKALGDLTSGNAFYNGCTCFDSYHSVVNGLKGSSTTCHCDAPRLSAELRFIKSLTDIGNALKTIQTKEARTSKLTAELTTINLNLPARVWIPLWSHLPHHVVRIPPQLSAVLNSRNNTPYIVYIEVVDVEDIEKSSLIPKANRSLRLTKSEENLSTMTESDGEVENGWTQEDEDISSQYARLKKRNVERDTISQMSQDSGDSNILIAASGVRKRLEDSLKDEKIMKHDPEDPSATVLKEPWDVKSKRIRETSPYGHLSSWRLLPVIVKTGDNLRLELLASQLLTMFQNIWKMEDVPLWLYPYRILCLSNDSGLIEPILNTTSLHQIKKYYQLSLLEYFLQEYGPKNSESFINAQRNFVQSCAAYSVFCYLIQLKDRHNGNILLTGEGHLIHIDFGYMLSTSPRNLGFETSPFKLTAEFVAIMDGFNSDMFEYFKKLILRGLLAARKHMDKIITIVEIMGLDSQLSCFKLGAATVQSLRSRFHLNLTEQQLQLLVDRLVESSVHSIRTKLYDAFQCITNGIQ